MSYIRFGISFCIIFISLIVGGLISDNVHKNKYDCTLKENNIIFEYNETLENKYLNHKFYVNGTIISILEIDKISHNLIVNNITQFYDYKIYYIPYDYPQKMYIENINYSTENLYIIIGDNEIKENISVLYLFVDWNTISDLNNFGYDSKWRW